MSEQQSEHLSNAQIEAYGERTSGAGPEQDQRNEGQRVDAHLDDCPSCRARVLDFQRTRLTPHADPQVKRASTPECPSEDDLRQLAAGLCSDPVAIKLTHHAATCDHCGPLLRAYTEDFSDDFSPEEQAVLDKLQSSSASWQRKQRGRCWKLPQARVQHAPARAASSAPAADGSPSGTAATAKPDKKSSTTLGRKPFSWKWILVPATAASFAAAVIVGVVGLGILAAKRDTPEKVEKLLAQAYTEQRTMEMRIPYAKYAPVAPTERGGTTREPAVLFDAKSKILRHLERQPEDWRWLHELGIQELLENRSDDAIANLNRALQIKPDSTAVMIDLASAYFQRSRAAQSSGDYRQAAELLGKVLAVEPNNLVALFNRAVLYEEMSPPLNDLAMEDWTNYLKIDPDGEWSEEAKRHKSELERPKKKNTLTSESQKSVREAASIANVYDEISLNDTLESWLPRIYPRTTSQSHDLIQSIEQRIGKLSASLLRRNHDPWLKEFYSFQTHPQFSSGAVLLARAIHENRIGNPDEGLALAHKASTLFLKMHNIAGVSRADYEEVYALQRLDRSGECLTRLRSAERTPTTNRFPWLKAQFLLEKSTCMARLGDLGSATREAERGIAIAQSAGFEILTLRALGMLTELKATVADDAVSWHLAQTGLKQFLSGNYPPLVGYQFYGSLGYTAENAGQWQLATALNREAVILAAEGENRSIEAMARYRLGGDALMAGDMNRRRGSSDAQTPCFPSCPNRMPPRHIAPTVK